VAVNEEKNKEAESTRIHGHCIVGHSKPVYEQNSLLGFSSSLPWKFIELQHLKKFLIVFL